MSTSLALPTQLQIRVVNVVKQGESIKRYELLGASINYVDKQGGAREGPPGHLNVNDTT